MGEGKNLVGVDIGTSSIKVCELKDGRRGPMLVRFGYAPLPPQAIADGQVMDATSVISTLAKSARDVARPSRGTSHSSRVTSKPSSETSGQSPPMARAANTTRT